MARAATAFNSSRIPDGEPWGLWNDIAAGDIDGMKRILFHYPDAWKVPVNDITSFTKGDQAIHVAARAHNTEVIDYLLSLGATLEDRNTVTGETPLMASLGSIVNMPKHLVEKGAQKDAVDFKKRTALHLAAEKGYGATAKVLVAAKFDLEARDEDGNTPLLLALQEQRADASLALLHAGAKVNTPGKDGILAVDIAFKFKNIFDNEGPWMEIYQTIRDRSVEEKLQASIASAQTAAHSLKHGNGHDVPAPAKAAFRPKIRI